ncbi:MAG: hypothetical protein WEB19_02010 [Acidimicrobiia bacterium]
MTQQLHLVEPAQKLQSADNPRRPSSSPRRTTRAGAVRSARTASPRARRAASWGDWQLDPRTRRVGKAGVAAARRALQEAAAGAHAVQKQRRAS